MKDFFIMAALATCTVAAWAGNSKETKVDSTMTYMLQGGVTSTRATKTTHSHSKNLNQNKSNRWTSGRHPLRALTLIIGHHHLRCRQRHRLHIHARARHRPSRINITSNGIPMNDAESNQVYWVNIGDFASSVQSMQIQRGVGTSTNGAGAFGRPLNMQTEHRHATLRGTRPVGRQLLFAQGDPGFGTGLMHDHWALQAACRTSGARAIWTGHRPNWTAISCKRDISATTRWWNSSPSTATSRPITHGTTPANTAEPLRQTLQPVRRILWCRRQQTLLSESDRQLLYHQQHYQLIWDQILDKDWNLSVALHYTKRTGLLRGVQGQTHVGGISADHRLEHAGRPGAPEKMDNDFYGPWQAWTMTTTRGLQPSWAEDGTNTTAITSAKVVWTGSPITCWKMPGQ